MNLNLSKGHFFKIITPLIIALTIAYISEYLQNAWQGADAFVSFYMGRRLGYMNWYSVPSWLQSVFRNEYNIRVLIFGIASVFAFPLPIGSTIVYLFARLYGVIGGARHKGNYIWMIITALSSAIGAIGCSLTTSDATLLAFLGGLFLFTIWISLLITLQSIAGLIRKRLMLPATSIGDPE